MSTPDPDDSGSNPRAVTTYNYDEGYTGLIDQDAKDELTRTYLGLNPAELKRAITGCQDRLLELGRTKPVARKEVKSPPDHPWRTEATQKEARRTFLMRQPMRASRTS